MAIPHIDFDDQDTQNRLLATHGCSIEQDSDNPDDLVLKETKGSVCFRNMTEDEARKCAAVYAFLYYEKGIEYSWASLLAMGAIGHVITHEEWLAEWDQNSKGDEARNSLKKKWADTIARWDQKHRKD